MINEGLNKLIAANALHLIYVKESNAALDKTIIKQIKISFPGDELVSPLRNEHFATCNKNIQGLRKSLRYAENQGTFFLEMEFVEGKSLKEIALSRSLGIHEALRVMIKLCDIVTEIHQSGWYHGGLGSSNIILEAESGNPVIIDSSLMGQTAQSILPVMGPDKFKSVLPFISPEQTGRTNRTLDHRTDLYSLGITLYELIAGLKPFTASETNELIFSHITSMPTSPEKINPEVPQILSKVVLKLLSKNAENRYQSALGLRYDLERIWQLWEERTTLDFRLGEKDFDGKLHIPDKLYGRAEAMSKLAGCVEETFLGELKGALVAGESGTGKSALVKESVKNTLNNRGYFLRGKFDQFARNIPYSAWIEVFNDFIDQLLTAEEDELMKWQKHLHQTFGSSIGVLVDLIPNLKFLIRNITAADRLGAAETQNRLNDILDKLFKSISSAENPVIIFLDDIQFADNASLNLMKTLLTDVNCKYLLLICAYRVEELDRNDSMLLKIAEIKQAGFAFEEIQLRNLGVDDITELIGDTLNIAGSEAEYIADIVFRKTKGNPFFTYQFIKKVNEDALFSFNWDASFEQKKPVWTIDYNGISTMNISKNVVDLLLSIISELPKPTVEALKRASCIGSTFHLKDLAIVAKTNAAELFELLNIAIQAGYIFFKNAKDVRFIDENFDVFYQFAHDRVQQAFYSLIPDEEKQQTHYEIGKLLFSSLTPEKADESIFQLVYHLNFGLQHLTTDAEKKWLAQLNFKAGVEAKNIIAYDAAYSYLKNANLLIDQIESGVDDNFVFEVAAEFLDSAYFSNRVDEAEAFFDAFLTRTNDPIKKATLHYRKMMVYQRLSKIDEILDVGLKGLAYLNYRFSTKTSTLKLIVEILKSYLLIRKTSNRELMDLPAATDPSTKIAVSLIYKSMTFAYDRSEELMGILGNKLFQLTIQKGNHEASMAGLATYGGILSIGFGKHKRALELNQISVHSAIKTKNKSAISMAYFGLGMNTYCSFEENLPSFHKSFDIAVEGGAHTDAAPATMYFFFLNFMLGKRSHELKQILLENLYFTHQIKTDNFHLVLLACLGCIQELKEGPGKDIVTIFEKKVSEAELEQMLLRTQHRSIRIYSRIFQMHNHIVFDRLDRARACEDEIVSGLNVTLGNVLGPFFHYLRAVLHGKLYLQAGHTEKKRSKKIIKICLNKLKSFYDSCPQNYQAWYYIVQAEWAKIQGKSQETLSLYSQSIDISLGRNNLLQASFTNLICADYNQQIGNGKVSGFYRSEAVHGFNSWGAESLAMFQSEKNQQLVGHLSISNTTLHASLDQESLFNFSKLISGEIDFIKLIRKLMRSFIENAGAARAVLIIRDQDNWVVEAEQAQDDEVVMSGKVIDFNELQDDTAPIVLGGICQFVLRTKETLVIDDLRSDGRFKKFLHDMQEAPRSLFCMPLINKGEVTGLVYLENNAMSGAFKTERVELLKFISSLIAVSIDNAKLYSNVRNLNKSYERFVPKEFLHLLNKKSILDVHLGDQVKMNMSVMFADIRDFTGRSEKMEPAENFKFINEFLKRMEPIIHQYNGFIDKYIGDEILALFPSKADDALNCGISMLHELNVFSDQLAAEGMEPIKIGIGLSNGNVMLGTVGGVNRIESTVISDTVNVASRVQNDTKNAGVSFMITEETFNSLQHPDAFSIRKIGTRMYRGKSKPISIYEVFDADAPQDKRLKLITQKEFELAVDHVNHGKMQEALELFKEIIKQNPADKPALIYIDEISKNLSKQPSAINN